MKRTILSIVAITVFAAFASAQDDAAYTAAMKTVNPSLRAIGTAITAKDNAAVATEAKKLSEAFTTINAYWKAKKADDAIGFSQTALDAAGKLASAGDADAQTAAVTALRGTCNGCHSAHRGGTPPAFQIK
jgi:cytochrome c551/c552